MSSDDADVLTDIVWHVDELESWSDFEERTKNSFVPEVRRWRSCSPEIQPSALSNDDREVLAHGQ